MNQIFNITVIIFTTNQIAGEEPLFVCLSFFNLGTGSAVRWNLKVLEKETKALRVVFISSVM